MTHVQVRVFSVDLFSVCDSWLFFFFFFKQKTAYEMVLSSLDIHGLNVSRSSYVILANHPTACVAQLVERWICIKQVLGSNSSQSKHFIGI